MATTVRRDDRKLQEIRQRTPQHAHDIVFSLLHEGEAYAKSHMGEQGSPAPAGAFPGIVTGELKNSLTVNAISQTSGELITDKDYAPPLEFGSSKMEARPFMLPTAYYMEGLVEEKFKDLIE